MNYRRLAILMALCVGIFSGSIYCAGSDSEQELFYVHELGECSICTHFKEFFSVPCQNAHPDKICKDCLGKLDRCSFCRGVFLPEKLKQIFTQEELRANVAARRTARARIIQRRIDEDAQLAQEVEGIPLAQQVEGAQSGQEDIGDGEDYIEIGLVPVVFNVDGNSRFATPDEERQMRPVDLPVVSMIRRPPVGRRLVG